MLIPFPAILGSTGRSLGVRRYDEPDLVSAAAREKLAATYQLGDSTAPGAEEAETAVILSSVKSLSAKDLPAAAETPHSEKRLTPSLLLTATRDGQPVFFEVGLSVVSGRSLTHVRSVLERADEKTVRGLFEKTGVPDYLMEDFWTEVKILRQGKKA